MRKPLASLLSLSITFTVAAAGCDTSAIELEPDPEPLFIQPDNGRPTAPSVVREVCNPVELHVVGAYSADDGSHDPLVIGRPTVRVTRPGSSILVLSNHEPVHWTVIAEEGAIIERVILNGYFPSSATVPDGVPVDAISHEVTGTYWPIAYDWPDEIERNLECTDVYERDVCEQFEEHGIDWRATRKHPGWAEDSLVGEAERVTGAALTTFHGCYGLSEVTIAPHQDGGAPAELQGACKEGELEAFFATAPVEISPGDGTCGAPLPVREVPTAGPCAGKAEQGDYHLFPCDEATFGISSIDGDDLYCEEALENCEINVGFNPASSFVCTFDGEVIYAAPDCEL